MHPGKRDSIALSLLLVCIGPPSADAQGKRLVRRFPISEWCPFQSGFDTPNDLGRDSFSFRPTTSQATIVFTVDNLALSAESPPPPPLSAGRRLDSIVVVEKDAVLNGGVPVSGTECSCNFLGSLEPGPLTAFDFANFFAADESRIPFHDFFVGKAEKEWRDPAGNRGDQFDRVTLSNTANAAGPVFWVQPDGNPKQESAGRARLLYREEFETGAPGWEFTPPAEPANLWRLADDCRALPNPPPPSGTHQLAFSQPVLCDYAVVSPAGQAQSPPLDLTNADDPRLSFQHRWDLGPNAAWKVETIREGEDWTEQFAFSGPANGSGPYACGNAADSNHRVVLPPANSVRWRFNFDGSASTDPIDNAFPGWYVDSVSVWDTVREANDGSLGVGRPALIEGDPLPEEQVALRLVLRNLKPQTEYFVLGRWTVDKEEGATNDPDPDADNGGMTIDTENAPPVDLSVTKDDGVETVAAGAAVSYTITVTNNGPPAITGLELKDALPAALLGPVFTPQAGSYDPDPDNRTWTGLNLTAGQSATLTLSGTLAASAVGTLQNCVTVTPLEGLGDPDISDNTACDTDSIADALPSLSVGNVAITENAAIPSAAFAVTLDQAAAGPVTVHYATRNGTAIAGSDYAPMSGTLTIPAGVTSVSAGIKVPVLGDTLAEPTESFFVDLSAPSGARIEKAAGEGTILDNDASGVLALSAAQYSVSEMAPFAAITVKRTGGAASGVTVNFQASDGTATGVADYVPQAGILTFGAGVATQTFKVPIVNDTLHEPPETLLVRLSSPGGFGVTFGGFETAVLTIVDNDPAGQVQFAAPAYSALEGTTATITLKRAGGTASEATVHYTASDGTATAGDYTTTSGTLTFGSGQSSKAFSVDLASDALAEGNESIRLVLSNPGGGLAIGPRAEAILTVLDAQPTVAFAAGAVSVSETAASISLVVNRTGPLSEAVTVSYATADATANAGQDYTTTSNTLSFAPNVKTRTILVPLKPDALVEGNETFAVTLSGPTGGASLGVPASTTVTIVENDVGGSLRFGTPSYSVGEPAGPLPAKATVTVKRTGGAAAGVSVHYATGDDSATAGSDYAATSGTLTFLANQTVKSFTVDVLPDGQSEGNETLHLSLDTPTGGATLAGPNQATLTILDRDPLVQFAKAEYAVAEKPAGSQALILVKRTGSTSSSATVHYAADGGTATNGTDYQLPAGVLTFEPGVAMKTLPVPILHNGEAEGPETVVLQLSLPGGAALGPLRTAVVTIQDYEPLVQFSAVAYKANEPSGSAPSKATVAVKRTGSAAGLTQVHYSTSGGTALAGSDYATATGTLTFQPGQALKTFTVDILPDRLDEPDETVNLSLTSPSGGTIGALSTALLNIGDNDTAGKVQFAAAAYSRAEQEGTATITLTRTGGTAGGATIEFSTSDGTATTADYEPSSGTLSLGPGEATRTFAVTIKDDALTEANETVTLRLLNPGGGLVLGAPDSAILWIVDDDPVVEVRVSNIDDSGLAYVNGTQRLTAGYQGDTGFVSVNQFLHPGSNAIRFVLENHSGGWTYRFQIRKGGAAIFDANCGQAGVEGCMNEDHTIGIVHDETVEISMP